MQKIKGYAHAGLEGDAEQRASILGALALYLDFINLFLFLLRIFGQIALSRARRAYALFPIIGRRVRD